MERNVARLFRLFFPLRLLATFLIVALGCGSVHGQYIWNQSISDNWSTAAWTGGTPTAGGSTTTTRTFGGSTSYTATDDLAANYILNKLTFNNTSAVDAITIASSSGQLLQFDGTAPSLVQSGASSVFVTSGIALNANFTVSGAGTGAINLSS